MCRLLYVGLSLLYFITILEGTTTRIFDSSGHVVFHSSGLRAGLTTNGRISFHLKMEPLIHLLWKQCNMIKNMPLGEDSHLLINDENSRKAIVINCFRKSQKLSHLLSSWIDEEELHSHPLVRTETEDFQSSHRSKLAHSQMTMSQMKLHNENREPGKFSRHATPIPREPINRIPSDQPRRYQPPVTLRPTTIRHKINDYNYPIRKMKALEPKLNFQPIKKIQLPLRKEPISKAKIVIPKPPPLPPKPSSKSSSPKIQPSKPKPKPVVPKKIKSKIPLTKKILKPTIPPKKTKWKPKAKKKPIVKATPKTSVKNRFIQYPTRKPQKISDFPPLPSYSKPKSKTYPTTKWHSRKKRFLTLIAAAVGVGITALAGAAAGLFHHGVSVQDVQTIAKDTRSMFMLEEHQIESIHDDLNRTIQAMLGAETELAYILQYDNLKFQTLIIYEKLDLIMLGLSKLLHKQLDPNLIHADVLREAYNDVKLKMKHQGAEPIFSGLLDLYTLSVGHQMHKENLSFTISLTIPGQELNSLESLFQYRPFPLHLGYNTNRFVMPILNEHYIGVTAETSKAKQEFTTMTLDELMECKLINSTRVCHQHSYTQYSQDGNCLVALFNLNLESEADKILSNCRMEPVYHDYLVQLSDSTFMLFLYNAQKISMTCNGREQGGGIRQGIVEVTLPVGCHGTTDRFHFSSEGYFSGTNKTILKGELNLSDLTNSINISKFANLHERSLIPPGGLTIAQATRKFDEDLANIEQHSWLWYCVMGLALFGGLLIFYWLITRFAVCKIWQSKADQVIIEMQKTYQQTSSNETEDERQSLGGNLSGMTTTFSNAVRPLSGVGTHGVIESFRTASAPQHDDGNPKEAPFRNSPYSPTPSHK